MSTIIENQSESETKTFLYAENHRLCEVAYIKETDCWKPAMGTVRDFVGACTKPDCFALSESPKGLALARCTAKYMAAPQNHDAIVDLLTGRTSRTAPVVYAINHALADCHLGAANANGFTIKEVPDCEARALRYHGRLICHLECRDQGYRVKESLEGVLEELFYSPGILKATFAWIRDEGFEPRDNDTVYDLERFYLMHIIDDLAEQGDDCHEDDGFTVEEE